MLANRLWISPPPPVVPLSLLDKLMQIIERLVSNLLQVVDFFFKFLIGLYEKFLGTVYQVFHKANFYLVGNEAVCETPLAQLIFQFNLLFYSCLESREVSWLKLLAVMLCCHNLLLLDP
jgi:hypothetical protein